MAGLLPRHVATARHLLLALLAMAFVFRMGAACEAMAATPSGPAAYQEHCADMPAKSGKPVKSDVAACALCVALPCPPPAKVATVPLTALQPVAELPDTLAGLAVGPAPPPPKIA